MTEDIKRLNLQSGDVVQIPEGMNHPRSISETVDVCAFIYESKQSASGDIWGYLHPQPKTEKKFRAASLVPAKYKDLAQWMKFLYELQYKLEKSITIGESNTEAIFQEFQIRLDSEYKRNRVNHFGLYAPTYIDALGTARYDEQKPSYYGGEITGSFNHVTDNRFLGRGHFAEDKAFRAALLGCSSISSAAEFSRMVKGLNPKASSVIYDNDPVSLALIERAGVQRVETDVLQGQDPDTVQYDLLATNYLITSLPENEQIEAVRRILETWKQHIYPRTGRFVLVERFDEDQMKVVSRLIQDLGYSYSGDHNPRTSWGKKRKPLIYSSSTAVDNAMDLIPEHVGLDRVYSGGYYSDISDTFPIEGARAIVIVPGGENYDFVHDVIN